MQFNKLRLSGFKSFVDPTELSIEPGMTGIVGPNGCGKSNLVEALKWAMGETSAKQMRGGEMEDVIFAGSGQRPARNIAEVTLRLDNADRRAPAAFNESDELEVVRRIERGHGSLYKVNGREARARDVQTLFADAATGSRSTALVSQGRVGAIIAAKPVDRRGIIDEAAGITGLFARRHEAELRLRAAETNLQRVQDVIAALEEQHKVLKRQARQAARYRNLSDHIRRAEAAVLALKLSMADAAVADSAQRFVEVEAQVADLTRLTAMAVTAEAEAAEKLPPLRQDEAAAAARVQRLRVAHDGLVAEAERVEAARAEARNRLDQIGGDLAREGDRRGDAEGALADLEREAARLVEERVGEETRIADAVAARDAAATDTAQAERALDDLTAQIAADEALLARLGSDIADLNANLARLGARRDELARQRAQLDAQLAELPALEALEAATAGAETALSDARAAAEQALAAARSEEQLAAANARDILDRAAADRAVSERERAAERAAAETEAQKAAELAQAAAARVARLRGEESGLAAALQSAAGSLWPPLIDALSVEAGWEKALGAAFGDELEASADGGAPLHWRALDGMTAPALPDGAEPLAAYVKAPAELARRLGFIGVAADEATGERLQATLAPGQQIVTRDGAVWRWDGYTVRAGAPTAAATRLSQRNRLADVRAQLAVAQAEAEAVEAKRRWCADALAAARQAEGRVVAHAREVEKAAVQRARSREAAAADAARQADRAGRDSIGAAERALSDARRRRDDVARRAGEIALRVGTVDENLARIAADAAEIEMRRTFREARRSSIADPAADRERAAAMRAALAELRAALVEKRAACDRLAAEAHARAERLKQIEADGHGWRGRLESAAAQIAALEDRRVAVERALAELDARPAEIEAQREGLAIEIEDAEKKRQAAADALAEAETALAGAEKTLKIAEGDLAQAREERVRREGLAAQATRDREAVVERIAERLQCLPEALLEIAEAASLDELPDLERADQRLQKLVQERETMGAVNLRAEEEASELDRQIAAMISERDDLVAAIGRLRQGIQSLNREGRERFLAAFETVSKHFQELFSKLFGGGKAELRLTESEDPLEAGLEIVASPPGKKLQVMSLLSGGEQALTATALLFAVFMTNPAPICVLDEVDAPLDDANVERFCDLVQEIAAHAETRFLIITHHRVTMAKMDRLYGVTMAERGVSQLVSVDLQEAGRIVEAA